MPYPPRGFESREVVRMMAKPDEPKRQLLTILIPMWVTFSLQRLILHHSSPDTHVFIAGYLVAELLEHGYDVVGLDNHSKYGRVEKSYSNHPRYRLVEGDAKDVALVQELLADCDHFIAGHVFAWN